jgi:hypothetical protein
MNFFAVLYPDFKAFGSKKSCLRYQELGFKRQFHFTIRSLNTVSFEYTMSHGYKCQKVTYYLNGPLH